MEEEEEEEGRSRRGCAGAHPAGPHGPSCSWGVLETSTLPRTLGRGVAGVHRARGAITQACAPGRVMGRSPGAFVPRANNRICHYPQTWIYRSLLTVRREGTPPYVDILTERIANHWVVPPLFRRPRGHLPRLRIKALTWLPGCMATFCVAQLSYTTPLVLLAKDSWDFHLVPENVLHFL